MSDQRAADVERWSSPFTQVELHGLWTYSDGALTAKGYRLPSGAARAGSWVLVDEATGNVQGLIPPGEFSRRFRPVDLFADVPGFPTYLGTVTASDGRTLVDLVLDRNPFMLANGPQRVARPHALIVPRSRTRRMVVGHGSELAACRTAMTLVAAWYRSTDGGHVVFCANDSAPDLDYLRDMEVSARRALADGGTDMVVTKNPRQEVQHAHLHAFYAEHGASENHESSALEGHPVIGAGYRAFSAALGSDAMKVEADSTRLAADVSVAAPALGWKLLLIPAGRGRPVLGYACIARRWTSSTGASHGPMASRRDPTRSWAGPSTWCGPAWPRRSGSMRHNGPQLNSGRVSRSSPPSTDGTHDRWTWVSHRAGPALCRAWSARRSRIRAVFETAKHLC